MLVYHYPPPSGQADTARLASLIFPRCKLLLLIFSDAAIFFNVICVILLEFLHCLPGLPQCMFGREPEEVVSFYS